ncbi:MAG: hypothetical protein ACO3BE_01985, partial [Gemmobacter sp.]
MFELLGLLGLLAAGGVASALFIEDDAADTASEAEDDDAAPVPEPIPTSDPAGLLATEAGVGPAADNRLSYVGGSGGVILAGGPGGNVLTGGAGDDLLTAGPDGDGLYGGAGRDPLFGGAGADQLDGGD